MAKEIFGFDEKFLSQLREMFDKTRLEEIEIELEDNYLRVSRYCECELYQTVATPLQVPQVSMPTSVASATTAVEAPQKVESKPEVKEEYTGEKYYRIKSPLVGTFYESPSPTSPPFVKLGDVVMPDTTVCIVEAMKVMNEIKAEVKGKIVKICKMNGSSVKADEDLFIIEKM